MALSHLPTAFLLVIVYAVPVVILYFIPQSLPAVVLLAFGFIIYIKSVLLLRVFKKYEDALVDRSQETSGKTEDPEGDSGIFSESDRIERENKMVKVFRNGKFVEVLESSLKDDDNAQSQN